MDLFLFRFATDEERVVAIVMLPLFVFMYVLVTSLHLLEQFASWSEWLVKEFYLYVRGAIFSKETTMMASKKLVKSSNEERKFQRT